MRLVDDIDLHVNPFPKEGMFAEGNMANISTTISINISTKPDVMENVHIGANCCLEEIVDYTSLFKESMMSLLCHTRICQASNRQL